MICPRCKTEVSAKDTVCPTCKLKLIVKCPKCSSPTRIGSVSCKKCGYTFVKFCPKCHSANNSQANVCRKCGYDFNAKNEVTEEKKTKKAPQQINLTKEEIAKEATVDVQQTKPVANDTKPLLFYIDFINLDRTFEKYDKDEFKQKVTQNIKTTVKIAFGENCDFVNSHVVMFKLKYNKATTNLYQKLKQFEEEFENFNKILEKTLDTGISYKFAISTIDEVKAAKKVVQLKYGSDKDLVISTGAYIRLNGEMSFVKIATETYKLILLDQKPSFEQSEDDKYDKALEKILSNLADNNSEVRAISVNAPRGVGKTHLFNDLYYRINKNSAQSTVVFYAQCSALTQISHYGLIQSFFMSFFDCPVVLRDEFNLKSFEKKVLEKLSLESIDEENLETLANLIYPIRKDFFENILINKEITY